MIFPEPCRRLPRCFFKHSREVVAIGKTGFFGNFINAFFAGLQKSGGFPDSRIDQVARGTRAKVFLEKASETSLTQSGNFCNLADFQFGLKI